MKLLYYKSPYTDAPLNIAIEEYLCKSIPEGAVMLILWRNAHSVIIGRNQNPWREVRVKALQDDNGTLVRRLSGGGAVYHDLGNVNYTFLASKGTYDAERQGAVLIAAAAKFGVKAERTGRNDITVDGKKISGVAYYYIGNRTCHHGTILIDTNFDAMEKYLHIPGGKISGKGIASVKARVVNLSELADITADNMEDAMHSSFCEVYGGEPAEFVLDESAMYDILALRERFVCDEWNLGANKDFTWEAEERLSWGNLHMRLSVHEGLIRDAEIFSDAMDAECIGSMHSLLIGKAFTGAAMCEAVRGIGAYAEDVCSFIEKYT